VALLDIPLDAIRERDLLRLFEAGAAVSVYIDYKQRTFGGSEGEHAEFLADVSSFANTAGGDIVVGMAEAKGVPHAFVPFAGDADKETRRLEEIARSGLEPRIRNLRVRAVPLSAGGHVLIIRVPRSYVPPHQQMLRIGLFQPLIPVAVRPIFALPFHFNIGSRSRFISSRELSNGWIETDMCSSHAP
jgi:hypothetical protein